MATEEELAGLKRLVQDAREAYLNNDKLVAEQGIFLAGVQEGGKIPCCAIGAARHHNQKYNGLESHLDWAARHYSLSQEALWAVANGFDYTRTANTDNHPEAAKLGRELAHEFVQVKEDE